MLMVAFKEVDVSIRKIKAHDAKEDGDYIVIIKYSTWVQWLLAGLIFGGAIGVLLNWSRLLPTASGSLTISICLLLFAIVGLMIGGEEEVRRVPKEDLVEIKRYSSGRVTVVLDDERVKRPPLK